MSGEIREIYIILSELGTDIVLQEVYDACGDIKGDKFVSKELFWKYIDYLKQKERVCEACGFKHMQKPPTLSEKWFPKKKEE